MAADRIGGRKDEASRGSAIDAETGQGRVSDKEAVIGGDGSGTIVEQEDKQEDKQDNRNARQGTDRMTEQPTSNSGESACPRKPERLALC